MPEPTVWADGHAAVAVGRDARDIRTEYHYHAVPAGPVHWPVSVGRPPLAADAFQERPGLSDSLDHALSDAGTVLVSEVIAGDGGTGKTQLAAAALRRARTELDLAVWVGAGSRSDVLAAYAQAHAAVGLPADRWGPDADAPELARAFLDWLSGTERAWMVVLDDLADPDDLVDLWPAGPHGRVLVTTRRRDAAMLARGRLVDVGVFSPAEALTYLTDKLGKVPGLPGDVLDGAAGLAEDLGRLPLALAQASAVMINDGLSCAAYREVFADRSRTLVDIFPADPRDSGDDYAATVATTWSLATERADRLAPEGLAGRLLAVIAELDPNGIPEAALLSSAVRRWLPEPADDGPRRRWPWRRQEPTPPSPVGPDEARAALRNLHRLSLVVHEPDGGPWGVRTHALAQRATRESLDPAEEARCAAAAAEALVEVWPGVETDPGLSAVLRSNTRTLLRRHDPVLWSSGIHPVLVRAGDSLGEVGLVGQAAAHFAGLVDRGTRSYAPEHPDVLIARERAAAWTGRAGDARGAVRDYQTLLADLLRTVGPEDPRTMAARAGLATWRGRAGDEVGAVADFRELLLDRLAALGPDHAEVLATRAGLAIWTGRAGDPDGAARACAELVADHLAVHGPLHPETFAVRAELADWTGRAGDPAGAAELSAARLADQLDALGPDHPSTLTSRAAVAHWRGRAGDVAGAVTESEALLQDRLRVLGPDHPQTLATRANLIAYRAIEDPAGAAAEAQVLLVDQRRVHGDDHLNTYTTRASIATYRGQAGDAAGAAAALEELLADERRILAPDHQSILATQAGLARWHGEAGNAAAAARWYESLLAANLRLFGPDHEYVRSTRARVAKWRSRAGDLVGSAAALEDLVADNLRAHGPDHPSILLTWQSLVD